MVNMYYSSAQCVSKGGYIPKWYLIEVDSVEL